MNNDIHIILQANCIVVPQEHSEKTDLRQGDPRSRSAVRIGTPYLDPGDFQNLISFFHVHSYISVEIFI